MKVILLQDVKAIGKKGEVSESLISVMYRSWQTILS